jgi:hypothetical protein
MNASTCAPTGLGRAGRPSIRLSLLARAWRWLCPVAGGAPSVCTSSGRSPWVAAASTLAPGDSGRLTDPVLTARAEEGALAGARAAPSGPVSTCGGPDGNAAYDLGGCCAASAGASTSLADASLRSLSSPLRWAAGKIDCSGCVMPMTDPTTAHPATTGTTTSTDTRREPMVGRLARLLFSSLTMGGARVLAWLRLISLHLPVFAKMRLALGFLRV